MSRGYGIVEKVTSKEYKGKVYYGFILDGDETLYRTGLVKPEFDSGDKISFTYETNKYGKMVDTKSVKSYKKAEKTFSGGGGGKDSYWDKRLENDIANQLRISYQAATNTAVNVANFAIEKGFVKVGTKSPLEAYVAVVRQLAKEFFESYQAVGADEEVPAEVAEEEEADELNDDVPF
jgi:hypothetical protein